MPPKPNCACKSHKSGTEKSEDLQRISNRKIRKEILDFCIRNGDLPAHARFMCMACAENAEFLYHQEAKRQRLEHFDAVSHFEEIIDGIKTTKFTDEQLEKFAQALEESQSDKIYEDSKTFKLLYKDDKYLQTFKCEDWLGARNQVVLGFLNGVAKKSSVDLPAMVKCTEMLYCLRNPSFISPFHFSSNLMTYFATGSKTAIVLNAASSPSGSYTTLTDWLKSHSETPIICPPNGDVVTFFDNNQKIEKKWKVQYQYKSTSSVITTVLHFLTETSLQCEARLSPRKWLRLDENTKKELKEQFPIDFEKQNKVFQQYRDAFVKEKLEKVYQQQVIKETGHCTDNIDDLDDITQENYNAEERYTFVPSGFQEKKVKFLMGNPCFENPCSYQSLEQVFDWLIEEVGIGKSRVWTIVGCDGLPYVLGSRLSDEIFICPDCKRELFKEDFLKHISDFEHAVNIAHSDCQKYKDILLIPGLGHMEMNMTKAIFKLLWNVGMQDLAKMLGFNSPKAQASCQKCTSHHKSWQIFEIFLHAMAEEIVVIYTRKCIDEKMLPSLDGFYNWMSCATDPNLVIMQVVIFTYCLALHIFRASVRRNNSQVIQASKAKFVPLFFGLNMPFYMEIYVRDSFLRMQCPTEVAESIQGHESYTVSGSDSKGEGGDFVLESKNKVTKKLIPPGLPEQKHWTTVCRNVDRLGKIRDNMNNILNIKDGDEDYQYTANISREIFQFRKLIRSKHYFTTGDHQHINLSGQILDYDLVNFAFISQENMDDYVNFMTKNDLSAHRKYSPVFILKDDREKYEAICNKKRAELIEIVQQLVSSLNIEFKEMYEKKNGNL